MVLCEHCRIKKVSVYPYSCKCGYTNLCSLCRLAESHKCTFDYKMEGKKQISQLNPHIINQKIIKL
jgi:hypothetical protein